MGNNVEELISALRQSVINIKFKKIDGSERVMTSTLNPSLIPMDKMSKSGINDELVEKETVTVFDVAKQDWRSFRKVNLINWNINNEGE